MSTTKITERNLDEKFLQSLYTTDNPPTASDVGAISASELATAIQSLIDSGGIEVGEKTYTPSSNLLKTMLSAKKTGKYGAVYYVGKWIPERSGAVKIEANLALVETSSYYGNVSIISFPSTKGESANTAYDLENLSSGATLSKTPNYSDYSMSNNSTDYTTDGVVIEVTKNLPVYFYLSSGSGGATVKCNSIKIYADEV